MCRWLLCLLLDPEPVLQLAQRLIQVALTRDYALNVLPRCVVWNDEEVGRLEELGLVINVFELLHHLFTPQNLFVV